MRQFALPPLDSSADTLSAPQRRLLIAGILAAHAAGVWGLMQVGAVRDAVREAAPMFVNLIAPEAPPVPPAPAPPPPPPPPAPQPLKKPPPPRPLIAAAPRPAPAAFVVPEPPPEPVINEPAPVAAVPAPAPPPAPPAPPAPPPPKTIPASAVQYLEPPVLVYPRLSMRNG